MTVQEIKSKNGHRLVLDLETGKFEVYTRQNRYRSNTWLPYPFKGAISDDGNTVVVFSTRGFEMFNLISGFTIPAIHRPGFNIVDGKISETGRVVSTLNVRKEVSYFKKNGPLKFESFVPKALQLKKVSGG